MARRPPRDKNKFGNLITQRGSSFDIRGITVPIAGKGGGAGAGGAGGRGSLFGSNLGLTGLLAKSERNPQFAADLAASDVQRKADAQQEDVSRELESKGVDPRSGRSRVIKRQIGVQTGAAKASAANTAREGILESNFQRRLGIEGLRSSRVGMETSERRATEASGLAREQLGLSKEKFQFQVGKELGESREAAKLQRKKKSAARRGKGELGGIASFDLSGKIKTGKSNVVEKRKKFLAGRERLTQAFVPTSTKRTEGTALIGEAAKKEISRRESNLSLSELKKKYPALYAGV